jgi:hypothetical protein
VAPATVEADRAIAPPAQTGLLEEGVGAAGGVPALIVTPTVPASDVHPDTVTTTE